MTMFTQMYRFAAEPFFLSSFPKDDFKRTTAEATKFFIIISVGIFLVIGLFADLFALIVGRTFREGIDILPIVLGANILAGVWLNLLFWYKREEKTRFAIYVTFVGLASTVTLCLWLVPMLGYRGAAWARFGAEAAMVAVSLWLNRRYFPTPYDFRRITEYIVLGVALYFASEALSHYLAPGAAMHYGVNVVLFAAFVAFAAKREKIDVKGLVRSVMRRR
jgi:O-antigen/teichoic acid export membrane protein